MSELAEVREWFLMRESERRSRTLSPAALESLRHAVFESLRKRQSAEDLWSLGSTAQAEALASDALDTLREASALLGHGDDSATNDAVTSDSVAEALRFRRIVDAHAELHRALVPLILSDRERARARTDRVLGTAAVAAALFSVVTWWALQPRHVTAEASSTYSPKYTASQAVDHDETTEWLLPDGTPGYLELTLAPPATAKRVRLLNIHNAPANDRGTIDYRIEVYQGGRMVKGIDRSFGPFTDSPTWQSVDLGVPGKIERIRFVVKTYYNFGGGLAEAVVE